MGLTRPAIKTITVKDNIPYSPGTGFTIDVWALRPGDVNRSRARDCGFFLFHR